MRDDKDAGSKNFLGAFSDPETVARYADGPRRFVPGLDALYTMTGLLLAEQMSIDPCVLVLGAGGGLELKALAAVHPAWRFVGVDPSALMLDEARRTLGTLGNRVDLVQGYVGDAPEGPFDGAVCLLTMHFIEAAERQQTAAEIRRRLRPGAPFVVAHGSFPQGPSERSRWLSRYAAFAVASGVEIEQAEKFRKAVETSVHMYSPEQDEAILRAAGFVDVSLFYAAFTWRGWIAHA
ncbi:MAG: methyltransferase domain-containing protein [Alphaproteobacteria bacterium]|nr:methyltransferase domain-containing protein [Alphaproteobacteria bacterium]MCW5738821.1 methyltransferase domain-containing protein [Alphaproteobacteria bacterium]